MNLHSKRANVSAVVAFHERYGELPKQLGERMEGEERRLNRFLYYQGRLIKSGKLSPDRVALLEGIPGFGWDLNELAFEESECVSCGRVS